ncbi:MAG: hypothetical protein QNL62_15095, partial [Gammaproteobacteria bacterium]|nr:hypothetical protein [Gammaproteobacteria bacterium]
QGLFLQSCCISSILGGQMWGVWKMQEQFSTGPSLDVRRTAIPGSLRHSAHPWTFVAPPSLALCDIRSIPGRKKAASFEAAFHQASSILPEY